MLIGARLPAELHPSQLLAAWVREHLNGLGRAYAATYAAGAEPPPPLYRAGVRYREEPPHSVLDEEFASPWDTFRRGWGDCDDLCIYLLAERFAAGRNVSATVQWRGDLLHCQVRDLDSGAIEDPSALLGMKS